VESGDSTASGEARLEAGPANGEANLLIILLVILARPGFLQFRAGPFSCNDPRSRLKI